MIRLGICCCLELASRLAEVAPPEVDHLERRPIRRAACCRAAVFPDLIVLFALYPFMADSATCSKAKTPLSFKLVELLLIFVTEMDLKYHKESLTA